MRLFTYGTLKRSFLLHEHLADQTFITEAEIEGFDMHNLGYFPGIVPGNGIVKGEIFEVSEGRMAYLDRVEGGYNRKMVETSQGPAYVYILQDKRYRLFSKIESGEWTQK